MPGDLSWALPFLCFLSCSAMVATSHFLSVCITASSVGSTNSFHTYSLLCLLVPKGNMNSFCFPGSRKKQRKKLQGNTSLENTGFLAVEDQSELVVLHQSLSEEKVKFQMKGNTSKAPLSHLHIKGVSLKHWPELPGKGVYSTLFTSQRNCVNPIWPLFFQSRIWI